MAPSDSAPPVMAERSTPKTMSSRLMTMKFMQRGAAQAAAEASSPSTPKTEDEGSASKRRKTSHKSAPLTPTPNAPIYDQKAIQAAIDEEEKKRLAAIEKRAAELGDSHWVLDSTSAPPPKHGARPPLNVVQVGFGQIDYAGTHDDTSGSIGTVDISTKARFQFNMKSPKVEKNEDDDDKNSDSDSSGSEDGEVSPDSRNEPSRGRQHSETTPSDKKRARPSFSARRSEERKKAQEFAERRRKKEVKLNTLTSISGGGSQTFHTKPSFNCHACGKPGHKAADCSSKKRR
ncbi:hypothetical protein B0T16DRAFT_156507 [Cercophora newfieldiana]|uniref:CCHC-type domain-containing protein n=1 Tax=Cercophora newfieldiana TaxID=92897 RepID=A0AA39Y738_9PEZI|nr:hypothetical protein B0T16DRAFT_156507 [Cercophora newfieldiana]